MEAVEEELKKYRYSFVGVAEEMRGRTSGKGGRSNNQEWWTDEVARAVDEEGSLEENRNDQRQR